MNSAWNASTYDAERRRLVPCFDEFYGCAVELLARCCPSAPRVLDLGAGTGILSEAIITRAPFVRLTLLDQSAEMLERVAMRLAARRPAIILQPLTALLPAGPFDAIISTLAIHHLSDNDKRGLYASILGVLKPGGAFVNAEQASGSSRRLQALFERTHLESARGLGSSDAEIDGAIERMRHDQCATVADQMAWLDQIGFEDAECFYCWFRFAVFGGWRLLA